MDLYTLRMTSCKKTLHARRQKMYTGTDTMDYWSSNAKLCDLDVISGAIKYWLITLSVEHLPEAPTITVFWCHFYLQLQGPGAPEVRIGL